MPLVIAQEDVKATRTARMREGGLVTRTDFLYPPAGSTQPHAYLVEESPRRILRAHFHEHDQFQVFLSGKGTVGRHAIDPVQVHFSRKHTPYGPLIAAEDEGYSYLTLRNEWDAGAQTLPEHRAKLDSVPDRQPWQISVKLDVPPATDGVSVTPIPGIRDERGLDAVTIRMAPGASAFAPDVSRSAGQYLVVLEGSLLHEGRECEAITLVHLRPPEGPFQLVAGPRGLLALALNFPRVEPPAAAPRAAEAGELKVWQCVLCGFLYDEAEGAPDQGIAAGTRWADVPDSFGCPDCSATKRDFEMVEI